MPFRILKKMCSIERVRRKLLLRAQKIRSMRHLRRSKREMTECSSFLELPAGKTCPTLQLNLKLTLSSEIRNHIYGLVTSSTVDERCSVVPGLALAHTCQQIRDEYRPMCLRADVTIDWRDVPTYFNLFFPTRNGVTANIEFAPERMTIFNNTCFTKGFFQNFVIIDILPIVNFSLAKQNFTCIFTKRKSKRGPSLLDRLHTAAQLQALQLADVHTLRQIITHRNRGWVEDVSAGRIHKIMISQVGTSAFPTATFHIGPGRDNSRIPELAKPSEEIEGGKESESSVCNSGRWRLMSERSNFDSYLERVGLREVFRENEFTFFSGHQRVLVKPNADELISK